MLEHLQEIRVSGMFPRQTLRGSALILHEAAGNGRWACGSRAPLQASQELVPADDSGPPSSKIRTGDVVSLHRFSEVGGTSSAQIVDALTDAPMIGVTG